MLNILYLVYPHNLYLCSCASGDLSGKHGTIGIGSDTTSRPTYTFTDNNVLLTGSFSGKGYYIHGYKFKMNMKHFNRLNCQAKVLER